MFLFLFWVGGGGSGAHSQAQGLFSLDVEIPYKIQDFMFAAICYWPREHISFVACL